jgi:hypothetical protein
MSVKIKATTQPMMGKKINAEFAEINTQRTTEINKCAEINECLKRVVNN